MQSPPFACPHCGAPNPPGSAFCERCGQALPTAYPSAPRLVTGDAMAATSAGVKLQADALHKQAKKAAGALLAVAILTTIFTVLFAFLLQSRPSGRTSSSQFAADLPYVVTLGIISAVFWGLYFWARVQPLPAAIVGLVVYCTIKAISVAIAVSAMAERGQDRGFRGLGIGCIDIIIIAVLIQAISAGMKYRTLMRSAQQQPQWPTPSPGAPQQPWTPPPQQQQQWRPPGQ
jgi:hypothetical protein